MSKDKRDPMVSFRLPKRLVRRYDADAKRAKLSRSEWIRWALRVASGSTK